MKTEDFGFPKYIPRAVDALVQEYLGTAGGLILEGPRACGKTMTALHHANAVHFLDDDISQTLLKIDSDALLIGEPPVLLDEWQVAPQLWNKVRRSVDRAGSQKGRFILTGSAVPADDVTRHSGAGRFLRLRMHTLTSAEKGFSSKSVSFEKLARGEGVDPNPHQDSFSDVLDAILVSGFPAQIHDSPMQMCRELTAYLDEISRVDVKRLEDVRTSPSVILQLLSAIARNVANEATLETLAKDVRKIAPDIAPTTIGRLVGVLKRLFVVEEVPAFTTELRSRARLRKAGKYHLADPALAAVALGAGHTELSRELQTTGYIFESAVIHDLAVYAQLAEGKLWHYRDSNGHEMDAVITFPDGSWAGFEIKLGAGEIEKGAISLQRAAEQIAGVEPKFLAVITGTGFTANLSEKMVTFPLSELTV